MQSAYLAISYKCNQRCSFCPCSKEEAKYPFVALPELKKTAAEFVSEQNIDTIVISGGEPTIHPNFIEFLRFTTKELGLHTVVLSNGERYSDIQFIDQINEQADISRLTAITTIHSQNPDEHEAINGSKGSFKRSTNGLRNLCAIGADVIIKHCITKKNYKELEQFYLFVDEAFPPEICIQLCSIDYCGMDASEIEAHMLSFVDLQPYLEKMFDLYIANRNEGSERYMYAINMPFCACDPYYWDILTPCSDTYSGYASPNSEGEAVKQKNIESNVGTLADACSHCAAAELCPGTYRTAFEYFGNRIIRPYPMEETEI